MDARILALVINPQNTFARHMGGIISLQFLLYREVGFANTSPKSMAPGDKD